MRCASCGSENLQKLLGEIAIHFLGLKAIDKPIVWVRPELVVCLDCGIAQFAIPETELRMLRKRDPDVPKNPPAEAEKGARAAMSHRVIHAPARASSSSPTANVLSARA
jgi:hypothetical protein